MSPPNQAPRNPPIWWLKKIRPTSVERNLRPCVWATNPVVKGTVDSHKRPIAAENTITLVPLKGVRTKQHITIALVAYIPESTFCFGKTFPDHPDKNEQAILNKPMNHIDHASNVGSSPSSIIDGGK